MISIKGILGFVFAGLVACGCHNEPPKYDINKILTKEDRTPGEENALDEAISAKQGWRVEDVALDQQLMKRAETNKLPPTEEQWNKLVAAVKRNEKPGEANGYLSGLLMMVPKYDKNPEHQKQYQKWAVELMNFDWHKDPYANLNGYVGLLISGAPESEIKKWHNELLTHGDIVKGRMAIFENKYARNVKFE